MIGLALYLIVRLYVCRTSEGSDAAALLEFVANNQQKLFAFVEESREVTAYGPLRKVADAGATGEAVIRTRQLKSFYEHVDGQFADLAEELFELHDFKNIAEALVSKYNRSVLWSMTCLEIISSYSCSLPEEWLDSLRAMQQAGEPMPWLVCCPILIKRIWIIIGMARFNYESLLSHDARPALMRGQSFVKGQQDYGKTTKINAIIDELIDTEIVYYEKLQAFMRSFVETLRSVANGSQGKSPL